jgi:hypothetical protein
MNVLLARRRGTDALLGHGREPLAIHSAALRWMNVLGVERKWVSWIADCGR